MPSGAILFPYAYLEYKSNKLKLSTTLQKHEFEALCYNEIARHHNEAVDLIDELIDDYSGHEKFEEIETEN